MEKLKNETDEILTFASSLRWKMGEDYHDKLTEGIYSDAAAITKRVEIKKNEKESYHFDRMLDKVLTSRTFGFPIMALILSVIARFGAASPVPRTWVIGNTPFSVMR